MKLKSLQQVGVLCALVLILASESKSANSRFKAIRSRASVIPVTSPISTVKVGPSCSVSSKSYNQYMMSFKSAGVKIFPNAIYQADSKCGSEWSEHGTCCEQESLLKHLNEVDEEFDHHTKNFPGEIERILSEMSKNQKNVKEEVDEAIKTKKGKKDDKKGKKDDDKADRKGKKFEKKPLGSLNSVSSTLNELSEDEVKVRNLLPTMKSSRKVCVTKLNDIRLLLFCRTCSSRMEEFFEDSKAIIHLDQCNSIIENCHQYWTSLIEMTDVVEQIELKIQEIRKKVKNTQYYSSESSNKISKWLDSRNIENNLKQCGSTGSCSFQIASKICDSFITMKQPNNPLFESPKTQLEKQNEKISSLPNEAEESSVLFGNCRMLGGSDSSDTRTVNSRGG